MQSPPTQDLQRALFWLVLVLVTSAAVLVSWRLELTPKVESDFFFASDDPQLRASERIAELFPTQPQVLISARSDDIDSPQYRERIGGLSTELVALEGVASVRSLTSGPVDPGTVASSPVWSRLLYAKPPQDHHTARGQSAPASHTARDIAQSFSQLIVALDDDSRATIEGIERVVESFRAPSFVLQISGVPYVVELIRRHLLRDLRLFSAAAIGVFGLLIVILYRSVRIAVGTLLCCSSAALLTLSALHLLGLRVGLLTANLLTIVFVLTLSHIVFLTANWRRLASGGTEDALSTATRVTLQASFWCMVTTLLGFASLLLANAKPLRELGLAGALGSVAAILVAYGLYPSFLRGLEVQRSGEGRQRWPRWLDRRRTGVLTCALGLMTIVAAWGLRAVNTDPSLLTYFAAGSELRQGLEFVDQSGGSSPLYLVARDPEGRRLTQGEVHKRLAAVQSALEEEPEVGLSMSLPVLLEEARRVPLAVLLGRDKLVDLLDSEAFGHIARSFVTADRQLGLFFLRMHESGRTVPRREVVARLTRHVADQGLETELVGGLYELQGQLGALVSSSLLTGLGSLLLIFLTIAAFLARSLRLTAVMVLTLATVPVLLLGGLGLVRQPLDVISSPAANIAIALGIDSMIHLLSAVRRRLALGDDAATAWIKARSQMAAPILGAALLLAVGFGIFALSSFPPTQRFGLLVATGTILAALLSLIVLPFLAVPWTHQETRARDAEPPRTA